MPDTFSPDIPDSMNNECELTEFLKLLVTDYKSNKLNLPIRIFSIPFV